MSLSSELLVSTIQTIYMVVVSSGVSVVVGLPLGVVLLLTRHDLLLKNTFAHRWIAGVVNIIRSIPFIILMVAIIPFTRLIVGTSIGTTAAIVPLSLAAIPFFARITESALASQSRGLVEAGVSIGASPLQIAIKILLVESWPGIIRGITLTVITLIGYSAMAGAVGGGGLGDFAIRYGYQRFDVSVMIETLIILIVMVQALQWLGDRLAKRLTQ